MLFGTRKKRKEKGLPTGDFKVDVSAPDLAEAQVCVAI